MDTRIWQSPTTFEWLQPKLSGSYALTTGGRELGKISHPFSLSSIWHGESEFGRWKFQGAGFWSRRHEIRDLDTELLLGTYTMKWHAAEGTLTLADGQTFQWQQTSWFKGRSALIDAQDREVVRVETGRERGEGKFSDLFKTQGRAYTQPGCLEAPTMALLVFVAWFLVIIQHEEAAVAATSTAAVS